MRTQRLFLPGMDSPLLDPMSLLDYPQIIDGEIIRVEGEIVDVSAKK